ncbi:MAG TPA: hypothetical protein VFQ45_12600 [Longimicrobium sp.]|nr:hypothetical protein [Longimicrobium sp.]
MRKLKLELEALEVDSFDTSAAADGEAGTVEARQADADCTYYATCLCKTAYYHCGTGPHTIHSCNYTFDARCYYTCYEVCGTPPVGA